jgi:heat shock protein HslJ
MADPDDPPTMPTATGRDRPAVAAMLTAALLVAACAGAQMQNPEFPVGGTFAWAGTDANGSRRNAPADPTRYTITFEASGRATLLLDCNRGSAQWTRDGDKLSLSPVASTKMMCPRGSLDVAFASDLAQVAQWRIDGRDLVLSGRDGSTMRLRPAAP